MVARRAHERKDFIFCFSSGWEWECHANSVAEKARATMTELSICIEACHESSG